MTSRNTLYLVFLALIMSAACSRQEAADEHGSEAEDVQPRTGNTLPSPYAFDVDVVLSETARERLKAAEESVIVSAWYYGYGKTGISPSFLNDVGFVDIGNAQIELSGEGRASFDGSGVRREFLEYTEGDLQVQVGAYSGRRSSADNLLVCYGFQDAVRLAVADPPSIACSMIGEE